MSVQLIRLIDPDSFSHISNALPFYKEIHCDLITEINFKCNQKQYIVTSINFGYSYLPLFTSLIFVTQKDPEVKAQNTKTLN